MARNKQKAQREYGRKPRRHNYITCVATVFSAIGCCASAILSYCAATTANQISQRVEEAQIWEKQPLIKSHVLHDTLWIDFLTPFRAAISANVVAVNSIFNTIDTSKTVFVYSENETQVQCLQSSKGLYCIGEALMGQTKVANFFQQTAFENRHYLIPFDVVEVEYIDVFNKKQKQYFSLIANSQHIPSQEKVFLEAKEYNVINDSTELDSLLKTLCKKSNTKKPF